ncbi:MAG TPA: ComF family protein [Alphaproteobacteria bacterium]|jgi:ComF family protein|nr:ComF family protein [Alphaproteobacteria bacterium]
MVHHGLNWSLARGIAARSRSARWLRGLGQRLLDVALPPRCLACGTIVADARTLCATCWPDVDFIAAPHCACCGLPLSAGNGDDLLLCGACLAARPPWRRARAVFRYRGVGRNLVISFKHGDRLDAAPTLARWLSRAGAELLADADLIVPVPLHRRRLFARRYNQSAVLALALGKLCGIPVGVDALLRVRPTPSQGGLDRRGRAANVRGAIAVARVTSIKGRRIVLIDDVLTTGATVGVCVRALLRAGAISIDILTLARVTWEE